MKLSLFDDYESIDRRASSPANDNFYKSEEWLELRYEIIREQGAHCSVCFRRGCRGNPIQVDHIVPRSLAPERSLDPSNLQVMCWECNWGKRNTDTIDWRDPE